MRTYKHKLDPNHIIKTAEPYENGSVVVKYPYQEIKTKEDLEKYFEEIKPIKDEPTKNNS